MARRMGCAASWRVGASAKMLVTAYWARRCRCERRAVAAASLRPGLLPRLSFTVYSRRRHDRPHFVPRLPAGVNWIFRRPPMRGPPSQPKRIAPARTEPRPFHGHLEHCGDLRLDDDRGGGRGNSGKPGVRLLELHLGRHRIREPHLQHHSRVRQAVHGAYADALSG